MYGANEFADAAFSGPVCAAGGLPVVEATLDGLPVVEATLDDAGRPAVDDGDVHVHVVDAMPVPAGHIGQEPLVQAVDVEGEGAATVAIQAAIDQQDQHREFLMCKAVVAIMPGMGAKPSFRAWPKNTIKPQLKHFREEVMRRDPRARPGAWGTDKCITWLYEHAPPLVDDVRGAVDVDVDVDVHSPTDIVDEWGCMLVEPCNALVRTPGARPGPGVPAHHLLPEVLELRLDCVLWPGTEARLGSHTGHNGHDRFAHQELPVLVLLVNGCLYGYRRRTLTLDVDSLH